ncbi:hypothetical protein RHJ63_01255 [Thermosynechococcus sp. JY1334]|uniref:hypothetical protein n=1 Tax=unclassified Thermosynechococcus TaxID=2622553 RepID=UPI0026724695|nr:MULTISPECIES: hypothetical protein [unclassified Thermosynechococcus]MDR7896946.1 hypothetical protein [Thermosynechococcus sp. JY1332]MDR7904343.1 hypothetical protein [Thermosynechococcus sp. JY1334]MDR7992181.1 hypothetical protein [Thermosynechococcus sp. TG252]WKT86591.1 hypothetical protein QYC30_01250 [Thermosynechococcus sp. JY1339]WNC55537.1 hypothetical protein RHJ31_01250 [Thermosynechococcus sp. JY1331]
MSGNLEAVEREILGLQGMLLAALAEMRQLYDVYLEMLAPIARQQLITVSYQVCTQVFPEKFLTLEDPERQDLQRQIVELAIALETTILGLQPRRQEDSTARQEATNGEEDATKEQEPPSLSEQLSQVLYQSSLKMNHLLQRAAILPPAPIAVILEIASKAENRPLGRIPHLLTMMLDEQKLQEEGEEERDTSESPRESSSHHPMAAIYLQLEELEFQHPPLGNQRSQIRQLEARLATLQKQLHKKQRQYLVLKASRAWWQTWKANEAADATASVPEAMDGEQ